MAYTTIDKPSDYFNTVLYTGNGSTGQSITGVGFQPDWTWLKLRSISGNHGLFDSVRGATKRLQSNQTNAEDTIASFSSFDSDGFTLSEASQNNSGETFVSWNWKAGTSASGNTTGSGTPQSYTESYSTTAGFSIITFTGNGTANHTLPHSLGVAPDWFIIKKRVGTGDATLRDWNVYHSSLGNTKRIALNSTGAVSTSSEYWNNTSPTSSVINLGTNDQINGNNNTYICYAFAEKKNFSRFGSYVGNGSSDGSYIHLGFKASWFMLKSTSGEAWNIYDNKRLGYNDRNDQILANTSGAEQDTSVWRLDLLSNGVKIRGNDSGVNGSGTTYIFMAFAENPFVTSTGIPTTAR